MAKSLRSKREKRLRTLRREIAEPFYDKKEAAKLAAQAAALEAPKLPVRVHPAYEESLAAAAAASAAAAANRASAMERKRSEELGRIERRHAGSDAPREEEEDAGGRGVARGGGDHGERGVGAVRGGEEQHQGAVAALAAGPARGGDRQLRRAGLRGHADGRGAVPGGRDAGHRVQAVRLHGAVQVPVRPARGAPGGPRRLLLRAQDVARAAGRRGGGAGGGQRGRAAAHHGHPGGGDPRHGLPGQHHRALRARLQALRRRPPRRRRRRPIPRGRRPARLARVDAAPGRARRVRVLDQQQRRVRPPVRRAGGVRGGVPGPRAAAGEGRRRALHAALHHLVLPGGVPEHAAVRVAVHQQGPLLRAGPGGGPRRRLRRPRRGAGEPPAALRAPRRQRPERVVGVVGLRRRLPPPLLHEGEEVLPRLRRGGGSVARPAGGDDRRVHGRPRRRRRQRRAQDGAGRPGRPGQPRRRHHPAHSGDQQRAVPGETGEHGRAQGHLRRLQGDHGAPCVHDARYGDGLVPEQQRRLLARRQDQHHRLQGHVQGEGVRVPRGGRRAVRGERVQGVQARRAGAVRGEQRRVLEGDEARQDLLRLRRVGVAQRTWMSAARRWRAPAPAAPVGTPGARTTAAAAAAASKCTSRPRTHASGRARRRWGGWRRRWCCRASSAPDSPGSTSTSTGSGGTWIQRWRRSCRSTCLWRAIAPPAARTGRSGRRPWKQHRYPGTCKGQLALRFQDRFSTYGEYHGVHGRSCL